jgi:hypothetical protein
MINGSSCIFLSRKEPPARPLRDPTLDPSAAAPLLPLAQAHETKANLGWKFSNRRFGLH